MEHQDLHLKLAELKDQTWHLARESLDHGEKGIYRVLTDFVERLADLAVSLSIDDSDPSRRQSTMIPISKSYKGVLHEAQLDASRINGDGGQCVLIDGQWMTVSGAAKHATNGEAKGTNGWIWWTYRRDNGMRGQIDDLRRRR